MKFMEELTISFKADNVFKQYICQYLLILTSNKLCV